jgi:hypothetical protein
MPHNKIVGWNRFFEVIERVEKVSPWLSRQMARKAAEWPFLFSGLDIEEWQDTQVRVRMPMSRRNSLEGEISQGHLLLGAELALRLLLLRQREELPFRFRLLNSKIELHNVVDQSVEYRFSIAKDWEDLRLELTRKSQAQSEFFLQAYLQDGRLAASFNFTVGFQLEKFLPA